MMGNLRYGWERILYSEGDFPVMDLNALLK